MTEFHLTPEHEKQLLKLARDSIQYGLENGRPPGLSAVDLDKFGPPLNMAGACFVTLQINKQLRGCIGTLEPHQSLAEDVCSNAFASAFRDSRFPTLSPDEFKDIHIEISVLTPVVPMTVTSEQDLLDQLVVGKDGLVIEEGHRKATFLPLVWDQLPVKKEFLGHLKMKAGMPADYWSDGIKCFRYGSIVFEE